MYKPPPFYYIYQYCFGYYLSFSLSSVYKKGSFLLYLYAILDFSVKYSYASDWLIFFMFYFNFTLNIILLINKYITSDEFDSTDYVVYCYLFDFILGLNNFIQ